MDAAVAVMALFDVKAAPSTKTEEHDDDIPVFVIPDDEAQDQTTRINCVNSNSKLPAGELLDNQTTGGDGDNERNSPRDWTKKTCSTFKTPFHEYCQQQIPEDRESEDPPTKKCSVEGWLERHQKVCRKRKQTVPHESKKSSAQPKKPISSFLCSFCPRKFFKLDSLESHTRKHQVQYPFYVCCHCKSCYTWKNEKHEAVCPKRPKSDTTANGDAANLELTDNNHLDKQTTPCHKLERSTTVLTMNEQLHIKDDLNCGVSDEDAKPFKIETDYPGPANIFDLIDAGSSSTSNDLQKPSHSADIPRSSATSKIAVQATSPKLPAMSPEHSQIIQSALLDRISALEKLVQQQEQQNEALRTELEDTKHERDQLQSLVDNHHAMMVSKRYVPE